MREHHVRIFPFALLAVMVGITLLPAISRAQTAAEYHRRASVLRQAVQRCSQRLQVGDITACTVDVGFDVNRRVSMPEAIRLANEYDRRAQEADKTGCMAVRDRYIRDMEVVRRMQRDIQMSQQQLQEWEDKNEDAKYSAIFHCLGLLVDGSLAFASESTDVLNGLKGQYAKQAKALAAKKKRPNAQQLAKLNDLENRIEGLKTTIRRADDLKKTKLKAEIFWGYFTSATRDTDDSIHGILGAVDEITNEPIIRKLVIDDKILMSLVNNIKDPKLFPKKPYLVSLSEFLVDYSYDATAWAASRNRILQQCKVADEQLRAVNAMQNELKNTMGLLNDCVNKGLVTRP
jgi:hypothetical protein